MKNKICLSSFNSTGFGLAAQQYVETLLLFSDIVCMQEHFLLDAKDRKYSNTSKLRNRYKNCDMYIVPAFKENNQVSKGRGKGGLATLWDKKITKYVSKIKCENFRLQATKFNFPSCELLILNTYFPCDPRTNSFNDTELLGLLSDIQTVIMQSGISNIWLTGDLNCDFSRRTKFTRTVQDYFTDMSLSLVWENCHNLSNVSRPSYTYMSTANGAPCYSIIDHFACNQRLLPIISEAGVIHSGANTSNHSAIFAKLNIGDINISEEKVTSTKHIEWSAATEGAKQAYQSRLGEELSHFGAPECALCTDMHCSIHDQDLEVYTVDILETIQNVARDTLPISGGGNSSKKKTTPGWSEHVLPYQEESKFWHSLWDSAGRPNTGHLYQAMKEARQQYKFAIRRLRKAGESIQNDKFVNSILKGGANIFKEIKRFRGKGGMCSSRIDEEVGSTNISNYFADIYRNLYNKVEHRDKFTELCNQIDTEVGQHSMQQVDKINDTLVLKALKMMKSNKRDALFDIQSDCLINGPPELVAHLTNLIRAFIMHGKVPHFVLLCTLLPLVKDNLADTTSADNYRAIASGSLLLKLLDLVIILIEGEKLHCDQLQFGFQPGSGTVMCTWTATGVIDYFNRRGQPVYGCAMDLSKAFDMVEWKELFETLKQRHVDPVFLRVLIYVYRNQECNVKWNSSYSESFPVRNGVRQGAISSPLFFSLYINDLLIILRNAGFGCHIGGFFVGCLGYADDLLLLSASRSGLQVMVDLCQKFTAKKNLMFSTNPDAEKSKTKCIIFSKKQRDLRNVTSVFLNGDPLPWVQQIKHLGNIMQCDNSMEVDCTMKRGKFIGKVNSLFQGLYFADPCVKMKLMTIYVSSFYGSGLWDLFSPVCDRLYRAWNVAVRVGLNIPATTHRYLVEPLSGTCHAKTLLCSRFLKFTDQLLKSTKPVVRLLARLFMGDMRTTLGRNLFKIKNGLGNRECTTANIKRHYRYFPVPDGELWRLNLLDELLENSGKISTVENFSENDVKVLISAICTS